MVFNKGIKYVLILIMLGSGLSSIHSMNARPLTRDEMIDARNAHRRSELRSRFCAIALMGVVFGLAPFVLDKYEQQSSQQNYFPKKNSCSGVDVLKCIQEITNKADSCEALLNLEEPYNVCTWTCKPTTNELAAAKKHLKQKYKTASYQYHPDLFPSSREGMKKLNKAHAQVRKAFECLEKLS